MVDKLVYAQLSGRVYARTFSNRTTVPDGWTELNWQKDDPVRNYKGQTELTRAGRTLQ